MFEIAFAALQVTQWFRLHILCPSALTRLIWKKSGTICCWNPPSPQQQKEIIALGFDEGWKKIFSYPSEKRSGAHFSNLMTLLNTVLTLPNSNADTEITFSVFPDTVSRKINELATDTVDVLVTTKIKLKNAHDPL